MKKIMNIALDFVCGPLSVVHWISQKSLDLTERKRQTRNNEGDEYEMTESTKSSKNESWHGFWKLFQLTVNDYAK